MTPRAHATLLTLLPMAWALTQCDGAATAEAPAPPRAQDMVEAADAPEPDRDDSGKASR